jgi:two-component system nitrate/nitrite response regulator NarL
MRIVVVDRHPVPRAGLVGLLREISAGAEVAEFDTAEEALRATARRPPDLVLCGQSTGMALGPDWIHKMTVAARPGKVVVLGVELNRTVCEAAHKAGAWGHLPMTSSVEVMAAALRLIIAGGAYFPALHAIALPGDRGAPASNPAELLSERQRQVLAEIEHGRSNKEIAGKFGISVATVKLHVKAIFKALGAKNRTEAARLARQLGLVEA